MLINNSIVYITYICALAERKFISTSGLPSEMEKNELIGKFDGQRPDKAEEGSCQVYKSLCDDVIYLCWLNADGTTCTVEEMTSRLFDKYHDHDLLWTTGTKKPPASAVPAIVPQSSTTVVEDLTQEEEFIHIPTKQAQLERTLYHGLKELYSYSNEKREYEVPYDNETNSNELTVEPFAYPRHNPDCNNIEATNRTSRHDFVVKGSYRKDFKLLYRYDQMGAISKMCSVQFTNFTAIAYNIDSDGCIHYSLIVNCLR